MKKRILSFLLALLMAVSIMPMPTYAEGSTEATVTPTETPTEEATETDTETACPTCGIVGCTSKHLTWCAECKKDDCGKTHVFCEICQKNDCGQNHCPTCGTIDCTIDHDAPAPTAQPTEAPTEPVQPASDEETPDYSGNIGRYVKLNTAVQDFKVYGLTPSTGTLDTQTFMHVDFQAGTILRITNWMMMNKTVWYQVTFYKGGTQGSFVGDFPAEPWFRQTEAGELVFLSTCGICSKPDCAGHTWCETCEKYDCGINHSQPENPCNCGCESCTGAEDCECKCGNCDFCEKEEEPSQPSEPENTCDCGCESCTGAEGCECLCGNCDFCEKEEEPTEPELVDGPIYGSVNGQTITVNGKLPKGAKVEVTPIANEASILYELGIENGMIFDISVRDGDNNLWEPDVEESVQLSFSVPNADENEYVDVFHFVENVDAIKAGIEAGTLKVIDLANRSSDLKSTFVKAITAYQYATGSSGQCVAIEHIKDIPSSDGIITFKSSGFSLYASNGNGTYTKLSNDSVTAGLVSGAIRMDERSGQTFYLHPGEEVHLISGEGYLTGITWTVAGNNPGIISRINVNSTGQKQYDFTVNRNAQQNQSFTITYFRDGVLRDYEWKVTFIVKYDLAKEVWLAVNYTNAGFPNEPCVSSDKYYFYRSSKTFEDSGSYAKNTDGLINTDAFYNSERLIKSTSGQVVWAIVDNTGNNSTLAYLPFMTDAFINDLIKAYCNKVGGGDPANYELIVYVIKLQMGETSAGWHIDCKIVPKDQYVVNYNANPPSGFSVTNISAGSMPNNVTVTTGNSMTVADGSALRMNNGSQEISFTGWNTKANGTGTTYTAGSRITPTSDMTLYAMWSGASYTNFDTIITKVVKGTVDNTTPFYFQISNNLVGKTYRIYNQNGVSQASGTLASNTKYLLKNGWTLHIDKLPVGEYTLTEVDIPETYAPENNPYKFSVVSNNSGYVYIDFVNTLKTCTMTAEFANPAHGEKIVPSDSVTVNYGEEAYTEFHVKDGYTITGRRVNGVEDSLSGTIVGYRVQSMTGDVHIIAYTAPIEYSITFDLNEGSWPTGTTVPEKYTIESAEITLPTPTRGGYKFMGWATTDGATSGDQTKIESGSTGEKTYYATWEKLGHKVTYQYSTIAPNGAPELPEESWYAVGDTVTLKELPIIFGDYKITTWYAYDAQSKSVRIEDGKFTMPDSDVVIRGSWYTSMTGRFVGSNGSIMGTFTNELASSTSENQFNIGPMLGVHGGKKVTATAADNYIIVDVTVNGVQDPNFTEKEYVYTVPEGGPYEKIDIEVHVKEKPDLTVSLSGSGSDQNFVFEVTRSDGVAFDPIDVVLCSENNFRVTIKNLPVGEYTVTEKDGWSWRENDVNSQTVDLSTTSQTVHFDFGDVDNLHWLSGYSYNRKKGGS